MVTVTRKQCDIFGREDEVYSVRVVTERWDDGEGRYMPEPDQPEPVDMGEKARVRLAKKIDQGMTPPASRKKGE